MWAMARSRFERGAGGGDRLGQAQREGVEPALGQGVQQGRPVGEVPPWRRVTDSEPSGELAQGQGGGSVLDDGAFRLLE